ncbi:MAG: YHS domain-containing protein [Planctomycetes bacterium]|nr:YHS domain-containing protein [Planctomycetota bacterium]
MWVVPGTAAARRTRDGQRFVFCSLQCAERFDDDPQRFQPA